MAGGTGTKEWIQFFTDSGIPASIAASYALTFSSNRIRMDMLLDLNKEYLRDMGITLMGDVISILRHAKQVHEQNAREKVLNSSSSSIVLQTQSPVKSTPAARMLDHYMRKTDQNKNEDVDESPLQHVSPSKKKAKVNTPDSSEAKTKKATIKLKAETELEAPPAKKVRRVLPEHEGGYKITMPSGTTRRSQEILGKQHLLSQKRKTVFERLGDGNVTSTTESDGPSITITGLGQTIVKSAHSPSEKPSSVFSRLGEKSQVSSTSNTELEKDKPLTQTVSFSRAPVLPYAGVLKQEARKKVVKQPQIKRLKVPTMQADLESASQPTQLQERLGKPVAENTSILKPSGARLVKKFVRTTAGIFGNPSNNKRLSIKARLGSSDSESEVSVNKNKVVMMNRDDKLQPEPSSSTSTVKSVRFGGVTKKTFIPQEAVSFSKVSRLQKGFGRFPTKTGVFSRLGR